VRHITNWRLLVYLQKMLLHIKALMSRIGYWFVANIGRKEAPTLTGLAFEAAGARRENFYGVQF